MKSLLTLQQGKLKSWETEEGMKGMGIMWHIHTSYDYMAGTRVGHSYMYLITHLRRKGIYHRAIYLRNWNSLHPISTNKSKFCHFR